jgi:hypothetical protein
MTTPHVYTAIAAVAGEMAAAGISKSRTADTGRGGKYQFRGIDDVYNTLSPLLAKHGLVILPRVMSREVTERRTASGSVLMYVVVDMEYDLVAAKDGSKHTARVIGEAMDSGDKASNKAMSAAYKYMAFMSFAIPTIGADSEDDTHHDIAPREVRPVSEPTVDPARQKVIRRVADACIAKHAQGDAWGCYEEASAINQPDERVLLWNFLHDHSKVRSTIKEMAELEKKQKVAA